LPGCVETFARGDAVAEFSARYTCGDTAVDRGFARGEEVMDEMATSAPVVVTWKNEGLLFEGVTPHGRVDLSSGPDDPGQGATPMELLAVALAGCTGIDVVSILRKMRQPLEELRVEVHGETADERPKRFLSLEVVYFLKGALDEKKVQRAVELSETKYCSVAATLQPGVGISSRYVLEG
jgi:putative redox protein